MTDQARRVLDEALRLPLDDRANVATELLRSLDEAEQLLAPEEIEQQWAAEIAKRAERATIGASSGRDAEQVLRSLEAKLRKRWRMPHTDMEPATQANADVALRAFMAKFVRKQQQERVASLFLPLRKRARPRALLDACDQTPLSTSSRSARVRACPVSIAGPLASGLLDRERSSRRSAAQSRLPKREQAMRRCLSHRAEPSGSTPSTSAADT